MGRSNIFNGNGFQPVNLGQQRAQQVANQLQDYDSYQGGKVQHARSGDNAPQWSQYRLGDLNQNNSQTIGRVGRKPGQDNPEENSYGKYIKQNPDKVNEIYHR
jgi:hypothetical protein